MFNCRDNSGNDREWVRGIPEDVFVTNDVSQVSGRRKMLQNVTPSQTSHLVPRQSILTEGPPLCTLYCKVFDVKEVYQSSEWSDSWSWDFRLFCDVQLFFVKNNYLVWQVSFFYSWTINIFLLDIYFTALQVQMFGVPWHSPPDTLNKWSSHSVSEIFVFSSDQ